VNILNHVAILTHSVEQSARKLSAFPSGEIKEFPGECTKEIYIGEIEKDRGLLLLMEPIAKGVYQRAMEKRGPGLHHIAIDVESLADFTEQIVGSGWFLLPQSLKQAAKQKTVWLARPGFPALIEVQARANFQERKKSFIMTIEIPAEEKLIQALAVKEIKKSPDRKLWLDIQGQRFTVNSLC
jgi:hypothetical protein